MTLHGLPRHGEALEDVDEVGELVGGEDLVLVGEDEGDGDAEEDLGALVEEAVPDAEDGLDGEDVGEEADEPLGADELPGHLEGLHVAVDAGGLGPGRRSETMY